MPATAAVVTAVAIVAGALSRPLNTLARLRLMSRTQSLLACFPGGGAQYGAHFDGGGRDGRRLTAVAYANCGWAPEHGGELLLLDEIGADETLVWSNETLGQGARADEVRGDGAWEEKTGADGSRGQETPADGTRSDEAGTDDTRRDETLADSALADEIARALSQPAQPAGTEHDLSVARGVGAVRIHSGEATGRVVRGEHLAATTVSRVTGGAKSGNRGYVQSVAAIDRGTASSDRVIGASNRGTASHDQGNEWRAEREGSGAPAGAGAVRCPGPCWRAVAPQADTLILFRADRTLHKVAPAHATRYALTTFFFGHAT
jgi:hypothetical protein